MDKKDYYFGHFLPESEICKYIGPAISANRMQIGMLSELVQKQLLKVFSAYPIASFPKNKKLFLGGAKHTLPFKFKMIPTINIFLIKQLFIETFIFWKLLFGANKNSVVITFNPYLELSSPVLFVKKIKKFSTLCVVADIPTTIPESYSKFKKWIRKKEIKKYNNNINKYDGLIVLNKEVIKKYDFAGPYYVMNGGVSDSELLESSFIEPKKHDNNVVLFSGALEEYNGVITLIKAFSLIADQNIKLYIAGSGSLTNFINEQASKDNRIVFLGQVPHDEIKKLQKRVGLLINPRPINSFSMRLSFPSKLFEYMLSGTPVMSTKHNELVGKYHDILYLIDDDEMSIANGIRNFFNLSLDERYLKTMKAFAFLKENMTYSIHAKQIKRIMEAIRK